MSVYGAVAVGLLSATMALATEWPQWRGPNRDAVVSDEPSGPPWPGELTERWRSEVGSGQSGPVVSGTTVFLFTRESDNEVARALDLRTGAVLWRQGYRAPYSVYPGAASYGSGPRSTPVLHDGRLFTLGIGGILTAWSAADGRRLWQKDFAGRFPASAPPFGTSMSPLIASGLLIVHAGGHDGGALIAFDPATGTETWTLKGEGPSYSSPILVTFDGQAQVVIQVHRRLLGVHSTTGRILWSLPFVTPCDQNIVTPLSAGDLLVVSSLDQGTQGIRVRRKGTEWVPEVVWHTDDVSMYMSTPVLANGRVLGLSHRKKGQFFALEPATGAILWKSEGGQGENAVFMRSGTSVLVLQGDGTLLVQPDGAASFSPAKRYRVASSATLAHPVLTTFGLLVKDETGLSLLAREARSVSWPGSQD
jgi:outer membrane protein assembly factor BamB